MLVGALLSGGAALAECDPNICVGDPCTITGTHLLDDGCTLDLGGKTATVAGSASLKAAGAGGSFGISAGNLTVQGLLEAPGGSVSVVVSGNFATESVSNSPGKINVKANGTTLPGSVDITAGGSVMLLGKDVSADGGTAAVAGEILITAAAITTTSPVHADGTSGGAGGVIRLAATPGDVSIGGTMTANGGGADALGGEIWVDAGGAISIVAPLEANGTRGGDGGSITLSATDAATVSAELSANGSGTDASGGVIKVSAGAIDTQSAWNANGGGGGDGGQIWLTSDTGAITTTSISSLTATGAGGGDGGKITLTAVGDVSVAGDVTATSGGAESCGGNIMVAAGPNQTITISGTLDARSTATNGFCNGTIAVGPACSIRLSGILRTRNTLVEFAEGTNIIQYRESFDAAGGTMLADDPTTIPGVGSVGGNVIRCRCADLSADGVCGVPSRCENDPVLTGATLTPAAIIEPTPLGPCTGCPNGAVDTPGEECDDGNFENGDCCAFTCRSEPAGSPCSDGNVCTDDSCDGSGTCQSVNNTAPCDDGKPCTTGDTCRGGSCVGTPVPCDPCCTEHFSAGCGNASCEPCVCAALPFCCQFFWLSLCAELATNGCATSCPACGPSTPTPSATPSAAAAVTPTATDTPTQTPTVTPTPTITPTPTPICGPTPRMGCRTALKSLLLIKDKDPDDGDKLVWRWLKGQTTSVGEFADPTTTTTYALCVYDANGVVLTAEVPPNGTKWKAISGGFNYKDAGGAAAGIVGIRLRASATDKAKILVKGKGGGLPDPTLAPLVPPVAAQLVHGESSLCWDASYAADDIIRNMADQFKAKAVSP